MTWSWETCRSPSPSGTGRTPGADSGGKKGGAPTQDSPANPWDCGLARARSRHRSWRVNKKESGCITSDVSDRPSRAEINLNTRECVTDVAG